MSDVASTYPSAAGGNGSERERGRRTRVRVKAALRHVYEGCSPGRDRHVHVVGQEVITYQSRASQIRRQSSLGSLPVSLKSWHTKGEALFQILVMDPTVVRAKRENKGGRPGGIGGGRGGREGRVVATRQRGNGWFLLQSYESTDHEKCVFTMAAHDSAQQGPRCPPGRRASYSYVPFT